MTKTIMVLAIAASFVAGATVFGILSDYEAEAAPKKPKPIPPKFPPMNGTLAQLQAYNEKLDGITADFTQTAEGIGTSPITSDEADKLFFELDEIKDEAETIFLIADTDFKIIIID